MIRMDPKPETDPHFRVRLMDYGNEMTSYGEIKGRIEDGRSYISSYHVDAIYGKRVEFLKKYCNPALIDPWLYALFTKPLLVE